MVSPGCGTACVLAHEVDHACFAPGIFLWHQNREIYRGGPRDPGRHASRRRPMSARPSFLRAKAEHPTFGVWLSGVVGLLCKWVPINFEILSSRGAWMGPITQARSIT